MVFRAASHENHLRVSAKSADSLTHGAFSAAPLSDRRLGNTSYRRVPKFTVVNSDNITPASTNVPTTINHAIFHAASSELNPPPSLRKLIANIGHQPPGPHG